MTRRTFLTLICLISLTTSVAQFTSFFESEEAYAVEIQATQNCFVTAKTDCPHSFEQAISLAKETKNDSLIGHCYLWIALKSKGVGVDPDTRWNYLREAMSFLKSRNQPCFEAMIYSQMAANMQDAGSKEYMLFHDSAMVASQGCDNDFCLFQIHMGKAYALTANADISGSINELKAADLIAQSAGDTSSIAQVKYGLGSAYTSNDDLEQAAESYKQAADLLIITGDSALHWLSQVAYCNIRNEQEKPEVGLSILPRAIDFFSRKGLLVVLPSSKNELAHSYLLNGCLDEAIKELNEVEILAAQLGRTENLANTHLMLAEVHLLNDELVKALDNSTKAYDSFSDQALPKQQMEASLIHAKVLKGNGQFEKSVSVMEEHLFLKDSLYTESKMKEVSLLQAELEMEQKEHKLCSAENDLTIMESKHESARNRSIMLAIALLMLATIAYALINRQKLKTAREKSRVQEKEFENENLNQELAFKNRELSAKALHIAQKNEVLQKLQTDLEKMAEEKGSQKCVREVVNVLKIERTSDNNWEQFTRQFTELNPDFYKTLISQYGGLTKSDLRLAALLRMNLSSKDISRMLSISDDGVKKARQRFRKKLELSSEDSLENYILSI